MERGLASVMAVARSGTHSFSKAVVPAVELIAGLGIRDDAHAGATVRHRFRVRQNPAAPNLCQVHLLHAEFFAELAAQGLEVGPGQMGENITTQAIALLSLPLGTRLLLGPSAIVEITGLRTPCRLMDKFRPGLMQACLGRDAQGKIVRKAGIMGIVVAGGTVVAGDAIVTHLPAQPHRALGPV